MVELAAGMAENGLSGLIKFPLFPLKTAYVEKPLRDLVQVRVSGSLCFKTITKKYSGLRTNHH